MAFSSGLLSKDQELTQLQEENQSLQEELTQCQADKDFVWSLWKRLQVANPDVTQAVSLVVQREKEKAELKDRKVLGILQHKDDRISELESASLSQNQEISQLVELKVELEDNARQLSAELRDLNAQLQDYKQMVELERDKLEDRDTSHRVIVDELNAKNSDLRRTCEDLRQEVRDLQRQKTDLTTKQISSEALLQDLENRKMSSEDKFNKLLMEYEEARRLLQECEGKLRSQETELRSRSDELASVRQELSTIWDRHKQTEDHTSQQADVIRQLRQLQQDTQRALRNQEEASGLECASLQNELVSKDTLINELRKQLERKFPDHNIRLPGLELSRDKSPSRRKLELLMQDLDDARDQILAKDRELDELRGAQTSTHRRSRTRARSLPPEPSEPANDNTRGTERELRVLIDLKDRELSEVRRAHSRRLERLRAVQNSLRLLKEEKRLLESEAEGTKTKKRTHTKRASVKSLQQENSDGVWNELTFYKKENKDLKKENLALEEEVDILRVCKAQDQAALHELRVHLQQEKEDLNEELEKKVSENESLRSRDKDIKRLRSQCELASSKAEQHREEAAQLEREVAELRRDKDDLSRQRKALRADITAARQDEASLRVELADTKHELSRALKALSARDIGAAAAVSTGAVQSKSKKPLTAIGKRYQRALNRSIEKMTVAFGSGVEDNDWEELSDSQDTDEFRQSTATESAASLGHDIEKMAKRNSGTPRTVPHSSLRAKSRKYPGSRARRPTYRGRAAAVQNVSFTTVDSSPSASQIGSHDRATSPIPSSRVPTSKMPPRSSEGMKRSAASLRSRVASLEGQVTVMRHGKAAAIKLLNEQKSANDQLQADLDLANQRLRIARQSVTKLGGDNARLEHESEALRKQLNTLEADSEHGADLAQVTRPLEAEKRSLELKMRGLQTDLSKQVTECRSLKTENENLQEKVRQMQDKMNRNERDIHQKRILIEELRLKARLTQETRTNDASNLAEVEERLKNLREDYDRQKIQLDSLRKRLAAVSKEKRVWEDNCRAAGEELVVKTKQKVIAEKRCTELETSLGRMETAAQKQLHALAEQSTSGLEEAHSQLSTAHQKLARLEGFIKLLGSDLVRSMQQSRALLRQRQKTPETGGGDTSLRRAQDTAKNILNISDAEMNDIMGSDQPPDIDSEQEQKQDRKWMKKMEKLLVSERDVTRTLLTTVMEMVDERVQLQTKLVTA